jgi:murein DD-endopeptidase MepM/ murein hydrolase activator NlpD
MRSDSEGSGAFAAPRGGKRHKGFDYEFEEGEDVLSPVDGIVTRLGYAYENQPYRLVEILSHKGLLLWKFLYLDPIVRAGDRVKVGQVIGVAQAISKQYGSNMKDHVHVEINIDPHAMLGGTNGD